MQLTTRDLEILGKLAAARWLTTKQIHTLFFATRSPEMVRRRLRLLRKAGYLQTRQDDWMAQGLHALTATGRRLVTAHGWEGRIKPEHKLPKHLHHLLGVNQIRVAVERGAAESGWQLGFFFAHWELEANGWPHKTIPDAVCEMIIDGQAQTILFEYDRGTEGMGMIRKGKLEPYSRGLAGIPFSQVIFVTETTVRAQQMARLARASETNMRFVFLRCDELTPLHLANYFTDQPVASPIVSALRVMPR